MGRSRRGGGAGGGNSFAAILNAPNRPLMYSILVSLLLFFIFQFGMLYRESASLDDQKMMLQAEIHAKERRLDEQQRLLFNKERDKHRLERRLRELEQKYKAFNERIAKGGPIVGGSPAAVVGSNSAASTTTIFLITPTYARPTQKADLTRLSYAFMHVPNVFWIVVEDASETSSMVADVLKRSRIPHAHIAALTPIEYKLNETDPNWLKPRGVEQRNAALLWLRTNMAGYKTNGVVYFADDDNTYDLRIFEEMRDTKLVSVWPVGLVGGLMVERPLVNEQGKVHQWMVGWKRDRPFPLDMAGFAIHFNLFFEHPDAQFTYDVPRGYQESHFLKMLAITKEQLTPKADNCTKVLVWHTRTEKAKLRVENFWKKKGYRSDDGIESGRSSVSLLSSSKRKVNRSIVGENEMAAQDTVSTVTTTMNSGQHQEKSSPPPPPTPPPPMPMPMPTPPRPRVVIGKMTVSKSELPWIPKEMDALLKVDDSDQVLEKKTSRTERVHHPQIVHHEIHQPIQLYRPLMLQCYRSPTQREIDESNVVHTPEPELVESKKVRVPSLIKGRPLSPSASSSLEREYESRKQEIVTRRLDSITRVMESDRFESEKQSVELVRPNLLQPTIKNCPNRLITEEEETKRMEEDEIAGETKRKCGFE